MKHLILEGVDCSGKSTLINEVVFNRFSKEQLDKILVHEIDFFELTKRYKKDEIRDHVQNIYISRFHETEQFYIFNRCILSNTIFSKYDDHCSEIMKRQYKSDLRMLKEKAIVIFIHISKRVLKKRLKYHPDNRSLNYLNQIRKDYLKLYQRMKKENPEDVLLLKNNTQRQKEINKDIIATLIALEIGVS